MLWGKHKEKKEEFLAEQILDPVKGEQVNGNGHSASMIEDIEANQVELQKTEANNNKKVDSSVSICMPAAKVHQEK